MATPTDFRQISCSYEKYLEAIQANGIPLALKEICADRDPHSRAAGFAALSRISDDKKYRERAQRIIDCISDPEIRATLGNLLQENSLASR